MSEPNPKPEKQYSIKDSLPLGSKERSVMTERLTPRTRHGGPPSIGKRKTERPFTPNVPTHLVLKSKRAKGLWSLRHRKHQARIQAMIYAYAERFKVHVYRASNDGHHIHLLVKAHDRKNLADFLRVLAGRIAVIVSGAKRGIKKIGKFWDCLCWSRLVNWGKDFFQVRQFVGLAESNETKQMRELIRDSKLFEVESDEWLWSSA